jgi:kanamycin kinase
VVSSSASASGPGSKPGCVCHGDSCAPNTLFTEDGHFSGHVDLGELGIADSRADLAIATWSTEWNHRLLWELGP